ncbi:MAG: sugar ABC transporter permease, partial [Anaerolineae bacterium]|nr:sugar ABC transporter permease [Anaerolineae bacterium]
IWGVGGVAALYLVSNWLVEKLNDEWRAKIQPFVFVGPAVAILFVYLLYPTIATFRLSLFDRNGEIFVGLQNYVDIFTNRSMFVAFRNNILLWIPFGALFTVVLGLLIAVLADRSKYERTAKALIFMPMAISMVGAAVIWNMIYDVNPNVGVLNWIYTNITGNNPQAWTASNQPWNNLFLIVVMIWLQTGFAMVLFSAA